MSHCGARLLKRLSAMAAVASATLALHAGGPLVLQRPGTPFLWPDDGRNIVYHLDQGGLGTLSPAEAVAQTEAAFAMWQDIPTSTVGFVRGPSLPADVDPSNFFDLAFPQGPDGLTPIVYDDNGVIFDILFGVGSNVLGFAGPQWVDVDTGEIIEGVAFLNGGALTRGFPVEEMFSVQVHEYGHLINLAHTVVNGEIAGFGDETGPTPFNTFPQQSMVGRIETMYPFIAIGGGQATPHADDIAMVSALYPEADFFATHGRISGTILGPDDDTRITGVNVIARNVADPFEDAVSAISSDFTDDFSQDNPLTGAYTLNGLTPGANYAVYVDQILAGAFSTPIRFPLPGNEDLYNGANESSDAEIDDPSEFVAVSVAGGETATGIDILFNGLGPGVIQLGDDNFVEAALPFPFSFCGQEHSLVFINSNGSLTFGEGSPDFTESSIEFLAGPPRIAPLWDDLNPSVGGEVAIAETPDVFRVRFVNVPEFFLVGANTFEVRLHRASNHVEILYGGLTVDDGLAGYTCGKPVTTLREPPSDLTAEAAATETINGRRREALYEQFDGDNDLVNLQLRFSAPKPFVDLREPNDTLRKATRVKMPFTTVDDYSEIEPGDVDMFLFRAKADTTLIAETVRGNTLDTLIGLFDAHTGELIAVDDDGGAALMSLMRVGIPRAGLYALAMTTFPDFGFVGDGSGQGRYVLEAKLVDGERIPMADDGSVEIPFENFDFPFQGQRWSSVFVNSNGNLTFGAGDDDFTETVGELLVGPPRIAALWDDLSPNNGGVVTVERTSDAMTVRFVDVPEFFDTGANTFSCTMTAGGEVILTYGDTNRSNAIVGISEGNNAPNPGPTDLSRAVDLSVEGTTYQVFSGHPGFGVDLDGLTLRFRPAPAAESMTLHRIEATAGPVFPPWTTPVWP